MSVMEEMTLPEVEQAINEEKALILFVGAIEQHGPHLPIGTDVIIPYEIAKRVCNKTKSIVAPPITYGYKSKPLSGGGEDFCGTISLNGTTVIASVKEVLSSFISKGFKKILVLNWHLENVEFVYEGINLAIKDVADLNPKVVIIDNPNGLVDKEVLDMVFDGGFPSWEKEHAAIFETSVMLSLKPELVKIDKIIDDEASVNLPYQVIPTPEGVVPKSGVLWHATKASKEKGDAIVASMVDEIAKIINKEFFEEVQCK